MSDIAAWLAGLGLDKYAETFIGHEIDLAALPHLTEEDLKDLGLPLGPRRKLLAAVVALQRDGETANEIAAPLPARSEAGRRQLTVMFVDLVGSTELSQRLDPEEMRGVLSAYHAAVSSEIARYEGRVAKLMGDGVLAYFGWPQAHEDDAARAVHAGLAATAAVSALKAPRGDLLAARVGIATGLVVVGDLIGQGAAQEEAVIGETPNLAARLQGLAEPNAVVIADSTRRLVWGLFELVDLGQREVKGFTAPLRAWRIIDEARGEGRFDDGQSAYTPLVGRVRELETLLQRWHQARGGKGQVVLLSGEPGIGKSRLTVALSERLKGEPHLRLRYFCSPYHSNSALHPVIKQLERAAGLGREDSEEARLGKLELLLGRAGLATGEAMPWLAALLSIDTAGRYAPPKLSPQAQKARTLATLVKQLEQLASREPVLMLVEDAHWIDPTTSEWLDLLIDRIERLRVLLVVSFRPEFQPRWTLFAHVTAMALSRLGEDEASAIVHHVAGGREVPREVKGLILDKTEGVPLFVEELTKTVIESGLLVEQGGRYVLAGPLPAFAIPSTLQDSLMARLDRLAPVRELAQIGACIGRNFHHRLLAAVSGAGEDRLESGLTQLEESGLVFRRGAPPEASYTFKHALVQDAAYQSLLKSRRQQIHAAIAAALEAQMPEMARAEPETLAHHFTAAGMTEQAVSYWLEAGQQSLKRSANREAAAQLSNGIELVQSLPRSEARLRVELQLQTALGVAMMGARGWGAPEVLEAFSRARALGEELGDANQLFVAIRGEAAYRLITGNLRVADELGRQCLEIAEASQNPDLLLEAHHQLWATKYYLGDYAAAQAHLDYGVANYDPDQDHRLTYIYTGHDPGICCRNYLSDALWMRGYPDRALACCEEAVALARQVNHPLSLAQAQWTRCGVHLMRGEADEARRWAEQAIALASEYALPFVRSQSHFHLGRALVEQGHVEEGMREMREGMAALIGMGSSSNTPYMLCSLAAACGARGETGEGLALVDRGLAMVDETGSQHYRAELQRVRGELLLLLDPKDETAAACFLRAHASAGACGARSFELRAVTSLARLWCDQGRAAEGYHLLAPVYGWFNEGLDTADLQKAKALLGELQKKGSHAQGAVPPAK
jgi:class 3 adenylate cyclase/tetratricopeptide (TPR) repeat protein